MNLLSRFTIGIVILICILLAGIALLLSGCASMTVNPETGEIIYQRFWDQSIEAYVKTPNGYEIYFDQDSKTEALKTALGIAEALK